LQKYDLETFSIGEVGDEG